MSEKCKLCPLHEFSEANCVGGIGPQPASILFVAESLGEEESLKRELFIGPAGQLLNKMFIDAGIMRSQIRIENIARCRPVDKAKVWEDRKGKKHFGNRPLTLEEIYTCAPTYLEAEIKKTNPVVIVPLGNVALHYVLGEYRVSSVSKQGNYNVPKLEKAVNKMPSIMNARGIEIWSDRYQCKIIPIIHPTALLRSPRKMGETVEDLRRVLVASKSRTQTVSSSVNYVLVDKWDDVQWLLARLRDVPLFSVDTETTGLDWLRHKIISIGFCWKENTGVALRVLDSSGLPIWSLEQWGIIKDALVDIFEDDTKTIIAHNAKFDMLMLMAEGISYPINLVDTMLMHHILDPESGHGLKELARALTDMGGYDDALEAYKDEHPEAKNNYQFIPWEMLGHYNSADCDSTFRLYGILSKRLAERPTTQLFFQTWILPFIEVVTEMEREGIGLDFARVKRLYMEMSAKCTEVQSEFSAQLGVLDINLGSSAQLAKLFFGELKMPVIRRSEKTNEPSVDEDTILELAKLYPENKLLMLLLEYRSLQKTMSTYLVGFKDAALFGRMYGKQDVPAILSKTCWLPNDATEVKVWTDGRIHADFTMQTTPTGRLCIAKGTLIEIVRDVSKYPKGIPIEDVKVGDWAYCFDDKGNLDLRKVLWSGKTGVKKVIRVHWQGTGRHTIGYVDMTPEHQVRLIDGSYREANNLNIGDQILSLSRSKTGGYARLQATGGLELREHRFVALKVFGEVGEHVHHKDHNKLNNIPSNLMNVTSQQHIKQHPVLEVTREKRRANGRLLYLQGKLGHLWKRGEQHAHWLGLTKEWLLLKLWEEKGKPERLAKKHGIDYSTLQKYLRMHHIDFKDIAVQFTGDGRELTKPLLETFRQIYQEKGQDEALKFIRLGYYRIKAIQEKFGFVPHNHRITKVEILEDKVDVYDLEIEGSHNFIANELCVHNSCKSPNLQNLKRNTEDDLKTGWTIRPNLIARTGYSFIEADFKQGEVFVGASLCRDTNLINDMLSKEGVHRRVYGRIYNVDPSTVTDAQKSIAKPVVFGTFFGQQADGLAELLKIPVEQAQDIINRFFNQYQGLKYWLDSTIANARRNGYVDTIFGRRRYLPAINSPDMKSRANSEHYSVNTPIQSTCHDLLIIASVKIHRDIRTESLPMKLVAENHDAFIYEVRDDAIQECSAVIKQRMEEPVIPELIPMQAEMEVSKSWKAKVEEDVSDAEELVVA